MQRLSGHRAVHAQGSEKNSFAPRKSAQLARRILVRSRFAEQLVVTAGDLIGANDQCIGIICGDIQCLGAGKPQRQSLRQFTRKRRFIALRCGNFEGQPKP